ncbi:MAG: Holliday junction branch migration protein RuvA [Candidatus Palauibacterales bacterium]|nr:Holliday junction branch migration protein RuvA [Candidatus Palauibacterales bacterium]MDP2528233.1 Holliday junction branch migration protein RuvA [Candidatus Palauibacterales bacterium]MDP2584893.1 Holliday junction branch migration protein RuvA [Candidatus Palauibacterales bacterium]
MIRRIRGRLLAVGTDRVEVLTVSGLGYEVLVPATVLDRLPPVGEEVELHTALVVRDDALELYGFAGARDRELFLRLQTASGVGPRLALALLGSLPGGRIVRAIRAKDHDVLRTVSGVGKKTAERIAVELADKLDDLVSEEEPEVGTGAALEAVQALRNLGYGARDSEDAVHRARRSLDGREVGVEELVRLALQHV